MNCYILRHGKDDESVRGGWSSSSLTKDGVLAVEKLAEDLASDSNMNIKRIFSSDLLRARQTAEIIASKLRIETEYLPQFREANNGLLAGMNNEIASAKYPGLYWNTLGWDECYPAGESPHQFFDRIATAWHIFKKSIADVNGDVLLVTHGGVINVIYHIENKIEYSNQSKPFSVKSAEIVSFEL